MPIFNSLNADIFRPPLGVAAVGALVVLAGTAAVWLYLRRERSVSRPVRVVMAGLRLAALATLGWALMGPTVLKPTGVNEKVRPPLWILADTSASMARRDVTPPGTGKAISRWRALGLGAGGSAAAADAHRRGTQGYLSRAFLNKARRVADVRLFGFDRGVRPLSPEDLGRLTPAGRATRLFDALRRLDARRPAPAAGREQPTILLLSDGRDTRAARDPALLDRLRREGRPVFTVPVGAVARAPDLAMQAWADADYLLAGQSTAIHAVISQRGYHDRAVRIDLLEGGQVLRTRRVRFHDDPARRVRFRVAPSAAPRRPVTPHEYRVRVSLVGTSAHAPTRNGGSKRRTVRSKKSKGRELLLDNNERPVFVQVSRRRIRAALFEGEPYWDTRDLADVLQRDPRVDLTAVFSISPDRRILMTSRSADGPSPPGRAKTGDAPPAAAGADADAEGGASSALADRLGEFDVVILGKSVERFFPGRQAAKLTDYVRRRGGALVLARGRPFGDTPAGRAAHRALAPIEPVRWGRRTVRDLTLEQTASGRRTGLLTPPSRQQGKVSDGGGAKDGGGEKGSPGETVLTHLPGMIAATRIAQEKAASVVLLRQRGGWSSNGSGRSSRESEADQERGEDHAAPGMAAVTHLRAGRGQVMAVLTDGLWRWALLPDKLRRYRSVYDLFWSRAIRWLAAGGRFLPGQDISLSLSRLRVKPGRPVRITIATRYVDQAFSPRLRVVGADGRPRRLAVRRDAAHPQRFHATLRPTAVGVDRLVLDAPGSPKLIDPANPIVRRLTVDDRSTERLDASARPEVLADVARRTGGRRLGLNEGGKLLTHLRKVRQARIGDPRPVADFARPWVFAAIVGGLGLEWLLRRRTGLL